MTITYNLAYECHIKDFSETKRAVVLWTKSNIRFKLTDLKKKKYIYIYIQAIKAN